MTISNANPVGSRDAYPATAPRDDLGKPVAPAPYFHDWDPTPHAIFPIVGVAHVDLGDVILGGTHQVEGKGRAEQRGVAAIRFDLEYLAAPSIESTARLVLPIDHMLEVKRYFIEPNGNPVPHHYAWIRLDSEDHSADPTLIPDYGKRTEFCCDLREHATSSDTLNQHGYELGSVMCDGCADSWDIDYEVVRY